jgi:hypothetical protein
MHITDLIASVADMSAEDLDRLQAAIDERRKRVSSSSVLERREYGTGLLQLEYRANPKTGKQRGPYWYYHYREDGKQKTVYVGKTDTPEKALKSKGARQ